MIIFHTGANIESISAGPKDLVRLIPGRNVIDDDVWGRIVDSAKKERANKKSKTRGGVLYLLENDIIVEAPVDEGGDVEVSGMSAKELIEVAKSEIDLDNLHKMHAAESSGKSRNSVIDAIQKQIEMIEQSIAAEG